MRQVTRKGLITVAAAGGVFALGGGVAHADSMADGQAVGSPGVLSGNNVQVPVDVPVNVCGNTVSVIGLLNPAMGNSCVNASSGGHGSQGRSHSHDEGGGYGGGFDDDGGGYGGGSHGTPPRSGDDHDGSHTGGSHSGGSHGGGSHNGSHGGGSHAGGGAAHSPGVGTGNLIDVPIDLPVNVCDLGVDVIGVGNPVFGGSCENDETPTPPVIRTPPHHPTTPATPHTPRNRNIPPAPNNPLPQAGTPLVPLAGTPELAHTGAGGLGLAIPVGAGMLLAGTILYRRARAAA